jgi:predicted DNA binding protein
MWEALLGVRHKGCPVSETSAVHPNIHIKNISKVNVESYPSKRLLCLQGDSSQIEAFADTFRDHEIVQNFRKVSGNNSNEVKYFSATINYQEDNPSIAEIVSSHGCYQHATVSVQRGIEHWILYAEEKSTIRDLMADIEKSGNDIELYRNSDIKPSSSAGFDGLDALYTQLTSQQQAAFETALQLGRYTEESNTSMEDIADTLGIHRTTAWEHITKAENKLLRHIGDRLSYSRTTNKRKAQ